MKQIVTIFLARSLPDSVAKRITRQTSDRKDCGSNSPGGECIYNSNQKEDGREKYNMVQGWENLLKIGCAVYDIWLKNWVRKAEIFITSDQNIGCANAHLAH